MLDVQLLVDIAIAAVAVLVAVLAIYLSFRLLGKLAKFVIGVIVVALVLWFLFSDGGFLGGLLSSLRNGISPL